MRSGVRALVAFICLVTAVGVGPGFASEPIPTVTVHGTTTFAVSGISMVRIKVPSTATLDMSWKLDAEPPGVSISSKGSIAGIVIQGPRLSLGLQLEATRYRLDTAQGIRTGDLMHTSSAYNDAGFQDGRVLLVPGIYNAMVLADTPARITLRFGGLSGQPQTRTLARHRSGRITHLVSSQQPGLGAHELVNHSVFPAAKVGYLLSAQWAKAHGPHSISAGECTHDPVDTTHYPKPEIARTFCPWESENFQTFESGGSGSCPLCDTRDVSGESSAGSGELAFPVAANQRISLIGALDQWLVLSAYADASELFSRQDGLVIAGACRQILVGALTPDRKAGCALRRR